MFVGHEGGHGAHLVDPFPGLDPLQHADDVLIVAGPHDGPGLRQRIEQLFLEMLGQAARDDQLLSLFSKLHQGTYRFLPRLLDEAAGVHHHEVGFTFIGADAVARLRQ